MTFHITIAPPRGTITILSPITDIADHGRDERRREATGARVLATVTVPFEIHAKKRGMQVPSETNSEDFRGTTCFRGRTDTN